jgi:hypothetical protein
MFFAKARAMNGILAAQTHTYSFASELPLAFARYTKVAYLREIIPRDIPAGIVRLFFGGSPSTVSRLVVPVIVNAINRQSIRPRPHISEEISEIVAPFLAYADAA